MLVAPDLDSSPCLCFVRTVPAKPELILRCDFTALPINRFVRRPHRPRLHISGDESGLSCGFDRTKNEVDGSDSAAATFFSTCTPPSTRPDNTACRFARPSMWKDRFPRPCVRPNLPTHLTSLNSSEHFAQPNNPFSLLSSPENYLVCTSNTTSYSWPPFRCRWPATPL